MPDPVKESFGYGLYLAQVGERHPAAKVLRGFHGAGVLELIEHDDGSTYRAVYTVRLRTCDLRLTLLPEKVQGRDRDTSARH